MRNRWRFIILLIILGHATYAQSKEDSVSDYGLIERVKSIKQSDPTLALYQIEQLLTSNTIALKPKLRAEALLQYVDLIKDQGAFVASLDSLNQALRILHGLDPLPFQRIFSAYLSLGNIYNAESAYYERNEMFGLADSSALQASKNYQKALLFADSANCELCQAKALLNLGTTAVKLFEDEAAKNYFAQALPLAQAQRDTQLIALIWLNRGNLADYEGDHLKAQDLYTRAREFFRGSSDIKNWIVTNINIATLSSSTQREKAIKLLEQADSLSQAHKFKSHQGLIQEFLYKIHKDAGNSQAALVHLEKYRSIQDSILTNSFKDKELRVRYETAKKQEMLERERAEKLQKELALTKSEQESEAYRLWLIIGAALSFILIAFLAWRARTQKIISLQEERIHQQKLQELEQIQKIESANALLKGQDKERIRIAEEIHDKLGGTLVAARMWTELSFTETQVENENASRAKKLLDQAIDDARTIAHNLLPGSLTKFGLKSALRDLIDSFNFPNGPKINAQLSQIKHLDPQEEFQLYLIAQEVLNNAIKHSEASAIQIILSQNAKNQVTLSISDNGKGFELNKANGGIGLKTIKSRVNTLNAKLAIHTAPAQGTKYEVTLYPTFDAENKRSLS